MLGLVNQTINKLLKGYKYCISPYLGKHCRFYPSCSCYAEQAFAEWPLGKASYLVLRRLLRCHPWHAGGYDPIPKRQN